MKGFILSYVCLEVLFDKLLGRLTIGAARAPGINLKIVRQPLLRRFSKQSDTVKEASQGFTISGLLGRRNGIVLDHGVVCLCFGIKGELIAIDIPRSVSLIPSTEDVTKPEFLIAVIQKPFGHPCR